MAHVAVWVCFYEIAASMHQALLQMLSIHRQIWLVLLAPCMCECLQLTGFADAKVSIPIGPCKGRAVNWHLKIEEHW